MPVLWRWITVASGLTQFFVSSGLTTGRWGIGVLRRHGRRIHVRRVQSVGFAPLLHPIG